MLGSIYTDEFIVLFILGAAMIKEIFRSTSLSCNVEKTLIVGCEHIILVEIQSPIMHSCIVLIGAHSVRIMRHAPACSVLIICTELHHTVRSLCLPRHFTKVFFFYF